MTSLRKLHESGC